ncbi:hypothetical protein [Arthrobacter sp. NPDC058127]|uniref:hypothetical protein n=1 Tax=Arthrobacter sp. NPDC058127 TaxID=3346351 RepID=UPI0036ED8601
MHELSIRSAPDFHRPVRIWPFVVLAIVLALVAAVLGAGFAYSNYSAQEWRSSANKSAQDLAAMTKERDDLKTQAGDLQTKLDDVTSQYNSASDRIRSLSNEKAQAGDQAAVFATFLAMAQQVTREMDTCIRDQQIFASYLANYRPSEYGAALNSARQADTDCNRARADSDALSRKLSG